MAEEIVVEKSGDDGMVEALNQEIATNPNPTPDVKVEATSIVKTPEEAKAEAAKKALEDPEFDLGLDENQKPLKFTKKQILEMQKNGMLQADYTKKTQEIAAEKANLKEVVDIIEYLKKNPAKAEKIVAILEAKEEAAKEKEFDLHQESANIDKLLADLPVDDPYAQALRSQKAMIQQNLKVNEQLLKRIDQLDQGRQTEQQSKIDAEAHQTLTEVMSSKQKSLQFSDEEEAAYWSKSTLTYLVNSPKEYAEMDKTQFAEYFNKVADKIYADIQKIGEKHVSKYIKSKGGPNGVPVVGGGAVPAAPANDPITNDNLQGALERELQKESDKPGT